MMNLVNEKILIYTVSFVLLFCSAILLYTTIISSKEFTHSLAQITSKTVKFEAELANIANQIIKIERVAYDLERRTDMWIVLNHKVSANIDECNENIDKLKKKFKLNQ